MVMLWLKIRRLLRRVFKPLTLHYWRIRNHRYSVAVEAQKLLPAPFDTAGFEFAARESAFSAEEPVQEGWESVFSKLDAKVSEKRFNSIGAFEMTGYSLYDVHSAFAGIDQDFYAGVAHRANEAVNSLSDLAKKLRPDTLAEKIHAAFHGVSDAEIDSLKGSVAEAMVYRHLQEAGLEPVWGDHNQKGWDLILGGHEVNVKLYKDYWNLSGHFSNHDTPVVVPGDMAHLPADTLHFNSITGAGLDHVQSALETGNAHVIADDALSNSDVTHHVQHIENLINDHENAAHGHFPFITLAFSGVREFNLFADGKTDLTSAAKNASLDIMGTGVGGTIGAKIGGIIGTFIAPGVGTALGAAVGGFFGARTARGYTSEIKRQKFNESWERYQTTLHSLQLEAQRLEKQAAEEFKVFRFQEQNRLTELGQKMRGQIAETERTLKLWIEHDHLLEPNMAIQWIDCSIATIKKLRTDISGKYKTKPIWRRYIWPDIETLASQEVFRFLKEVGRELRSFKKQAEKGFSIRRDVLFSYLGMTGVFRENVLAYLAEVSNQKEKRDRAASEFLKNVISDLNKQRKKCEKTLNEKLDTLSGKIQETLKPFIQDVEECFSVTKREADKLGITIE